MKSKFSLKLTLLAAAFLLGTRGMAVPPTITLTAPEDGATWGIPTVFLVAANALDVDGPVQEVEFYFDSTLVGASTIPETGTLGIFRTYLTNRPAAGTYTLTAIAYSPDGESTTSAPRTVQVDPPPPPPTVTTGEAEPHATWAKLNGTINPNGSSILYYDLWVEFGLSDAYGGTTRGSGGLVFSWMDHEDHSFTPYIYGLERGMTYHYRLVAKSNAGITYGEDHTFTTSLNTPPRAWDGFANVPEDAPAPVYLDFDDPDFEPVTITSVTQPSHGTVTIGGGSNPHAKLTYTPGETFEVSDEFTYTVSDQHGGTATAAVRVANIRRAAPGKYVSTILTGSGSRYAYGSIGINITAGGYFTTVVSLNGRRYAAKDRFSLDGYSEVEVSRPGAPPLILSLGLGGNAKGITFGGAINTRHDSYDITSTNQLSFPENAPEAGSYTMLLPAGDYEVDAEVEDPSVPHASGYITGRVSKHGRVAFSGRIGDGQPVSFGTQLRVGGTAQLYMTAGHAPKDRIHGDIQFPGTGSDEATGELYWYKAPRTSGYYQDSVRMYVAVTGSRVAISDEEDQILDYSTELAGLEITFKDLEGESLLEGLLSGQNETALTFNPSVAASSLRARAAGATKPVLTFKVKRKTGLFSGSLRNPAENGKVRKFSGAFLQHQNTAAGVLLFGKAAGSVTLTPK